MALIWNSARPPQSCSPSRCGAVAAALPSSPSAARRRCSTPKSPRRPTPGRGCATSSLPSVGIPPCACARGRQQTRAVGCKLCYIQTPNNPPAKHPLITDWAGMATDNNYARVKSSETKSIHSTANRLCSAILGYTHGDSLQPDRPLEAVRPAQVGQRSVHGCSAYLIASEIFLCFVSL